MEVSTFHLVLEFLFFSIVAGVAGALAMNVLMRIISANSTQDVNMIEALASLFTGRTEGALHLGTLLHLASGVFFGMVYTLLLMAIAPGSVVGSLFICVGFGFFHGLIVSYMLMYYVAERHPVAKYRNAGMSVGIIHLIGHVLYGALVGFIVGFSDNLVGGPSPLLGQ